MRPLLVLLSLLPAYTLATVLKTHGVPPDLLSKYSQQKNGGPWTCLDGSKQVSWDAVNDDYCDCPDGSDEPGTGACPGTTFYCQNKGHIGATISSTRVNDGLCERECCDGSDERAGTCPNVCEQVGAAHRKFLEEDLKLRKTGSKIRSTYITFAQKEKKRLEALVSSTEQEIAVGEKEVARLKNILDQTESLSAAALEHKKLSPLYKSLETHSELLKSLLSVHEAQIARTKTLENILDSLRTGYNPNYQDMAVLEAVRGWEQVAGLAHINDAKKDDEQTSDIDSRFSADKQSTDEVKRSIDDALRTDYISLLMEHDKHIGHTSRPASSLLYNISAYIPDFLLPEYEYAVQKLVSWLSAFGIIPSSDSSESEDATRARQALNSAESSLNTAKKDHTDAVEDLKDLFEPEAFGTSGEWKKLQGLCLEKDAGEYTYEVCLFGEAKQKSRGGSSNSLGNYASWNPDMNVPVGVPEYYSVQAYRNGAKCWNGPQRSVNLHLTCGIENQLLSVSEPEKCEYLITGTTPALCVVTKEEAEGKKDEL